MTATVLASGSVNPVAQVSVGTQVSGQIKELLVDFNSEVKAGQVLARIDPEKFNYALRQAQADVDVGLAAALNAQANLMAAQANLGKAQVDVDEALRDRDRKASLVAKNFIAASEAMKAQSVWQQAEQQYKAVQAQQSVAEAQLGSALANVRQRRAQWSQAKIDLDRTTIKAPVDGVVVKRSVDIGQTVAASLQTPELFIIARNLHEMQVEVSIDEADIGRVKQGQKASFTVDAFPGRTFQGEVSQVRKAASTVQNVVTYTVVLTFSNKEGRLLPGMTANVRLTTDNRENAWKVPNAALRLRMPDKDGLAARTPKPARSEQARDLRQMWVLDPSGKPVALMVKMGITDGQMTEVIATEGVELKEGMEVITAVTAGAAATPAAAAMGSPAGGVNPGLRAPGGAR